MTHKIDDKYNPKSFEDKLYQEWETKGYFKPSMDESKNPYCIVMPPPNANANLHIGHALDMNLKDIIVRFQRMKGKDAVFIPGADHAGFETWVVYEKELEKCTAVHRPHH